MNGPAAGPWRLRHYPTIGSTSDLCRTLAAAGEPDGLAVRADRQTAGRGSRGRGWETPSGNLALSVLIRPRESARLAGQWALLAAVALVEALDAASSGGCAPAHHRPQERLTLKWPNDILLDGRKLAGILLDSAADGDGGIAWMVVGMGANLAYAPALPDRPTACLADLGTPPDPAMVAETILERLTHWRRIRILDGFAPVRAAWLARSLPVGTRVTLRTHDGQVTGDFAGLGEDGTLLLQSGGRVHGFATGEVMLPDLPCE